MSDEIIPLLKVHDYFEGRQIRSDLDGREHETMLPTAAVKFDTAYIRSHPQDPYGYVFRGTFGWREANDLELALRDFGEAIRLMRLHSAPPAVLASERHRSTAEWVGGNQLTEIRPAVAG